MGGRPWLHKEVRPALVVLDIRMNNEERGWSILNLVTLDPETSDIPVIVCSAAIQSLHQHQELLSKYGIHALPKPFDVETLLETVADMLTGPRQVRASELPIRKRD
jgi:CheY-like chemotaxis protein